MKTSRSLTKRSPSSRDATVSQVRKAVFVNRSEPNHASLADSAPGTPVMAPDAQEERTRDMAAFWVQNSELSV